jgi:hypothetical protein
LKQLRLLSCLDFLETNLEFLVLISDITLVLPISPTLDLARYNRGQLKVGSLFLWAPGLLCILMDGHPQTTAVLCPCSLSQGFKEAVMRVTLFHSFHLVLILALRCVTRGWSIAYTGLSRRRRCFVEPEVECSCPVGDGDILYGRRPRCLVWSVMVMSCMAGDDC